jgi:hypothetical protein
VGVEPARRGDEPLREVRVESPVAGRIGVGERITGDMAADAEVIELRGLCPQARFDVAQTLSVGQLRKRHAQVLIEAGEALDLVFGLIPGDAAPEGLQRKMVHQLRKDELACVHR